MHQHAAGNTCDDARCKQQKLRQKLQVQSQQAVKVLAKLTDLRDRAARKAGMDHQPAPIAALPSNDRELAALPENRRNLFRENLEDAVSKALNAREGRVPSEDQTANRSEFGPTEAEQAVMGNGCAICRGLCCEGGGNHAFLNPVDVRKKLERNPGIEPADLVDFYLAKLPEITFVDSCVFHESTGCALDRDDRSDLCNNFFCAGMSELWHEERVMRFALIDENGSVEFANY